MATSEQDFASVGLTSEEWKTVILRGGAVPAHKWDSVAATIARLGGYDPKRASDPDLIYTALNLIGTRFPHLWHKEDVLSHEEKIGYRLAKNYFWSRDDAEERLAKVEARRTLVESINMFT